MNGNYLAFLVRFQRREGSPPQWYATLENAHTQEIFRFATAPELCVYLLQMLSKKPASPNDHPNPDVAGGH